MDVGRIDWTTVIVSLVLASPATIAFWRLHVKLVSTTIPEGFRNIVEAVQASTEQNHAHHQANLLAMANLQHAVSICPFRPRQTKKRRPGSRRKPPGAPRRVKTSAKKRRRR